MQIRSPQMTGAQGNSHIETAMTEPGLDFILQERRDAEFERAFKHSSKVKLLKVALPAIGVLVILGISAALLFNSLFNSHVKIDDIAVTNGKLVMENPQLNGFDGNQRPYDLSADKAIQDVSNPAVVELQQINANLPFDNDISAQITAGEGIYDADAKTLLLDKNVNVLTNNGMSLLLESADVDIGAGTLSSDKTIVAKSPQADISANSLIVHENGNHIIFEGRVRMILRPNAIRQGE